MACQNFRRFLFDFSLDVAAFKVHVFSSDFKFWIGEDKCNCRHSNSNNPRILCHECQVHFLLKNQTKLGMYCTTPCLSHFKFTRWSSCLDCSKLWLNMSKWGVCRQNTFWIMPANLQQGQILSKSQLLL